MKYQLTVLVAALFALTPFAGIAEEPYDIAVITPLTGPFAFLGKEEASALDVIQTSVNKSGGIRGRQIHFTIQDDQSVAQNAVQLLNASVARKATVILGSTTASTCGAMTPLVPTGPVVYCFSPGIHPPAGSFVFSASISTADYIVATIRYMRGRGWRKFALMTSNDATGQDAERIIDEAVNAPENQGTVSLVDREHFNSTDISVAAQIAHIKGSGAQAVIFWTVGTSFGTLVREATQGGLTIPQFTSAGNLNYAQLIGYQSFMPDNLYMMAPPWAAPDAFPNRAFRKYAAGYLEAFKAAGIRPDEGQSLAWDPAQLVLEALRHLGLDATPNAIRAYIAGLQGWTGINGRYDFKAIPQRGIGIDWLVMIRWDKNKQSLIGVSKPGGEAQQ
jgi:branched-chain amino acid transport system substrate-binding protein